MKVGNNKVIRKLEKIKSRRTKDDRETKDEWKARQNSQKKKKRELDAIRVYIQLRDPVDELN